MKKLAGILFVFICILSLSAVAGDKEREKPMPPLDETVLTDGVKVELNGVARIGDTTKAVRVTALHCSVSYGKKLRRGCWFCDCGKLHRDFYRDFADSIRSIKAASKKSVPPLGEPVLTDGAKVTLRGGTPKKSVSPSGGKVLTDSVKVEPDGATRKADVVDPFDCRLYNAKGELVLSCSLCNCAKQKRMKDKAENRKED